MQRSCTDLACIVQPSQGDLAMSPFLASLLTRAAVPAPAFTQRRAHHLGRARRAHRHPAKFHRFPLCEYLHLQTADYKEIREEFHAGAVDVSDRVNSTAAVCFVYGC
jgi:hypothetical protein